ncbi:hypothetical protein DEO72_LG8g1434 [Vigna unguiculata]|uniref:Uncharacterized protein n=1 Tax=Vigna unguiculata TaxID=3917 RepID=A0A4D6MPF1_VIGUN|nr:hypothetical protein DEO72_LG8g1434 [Vigna unguiculata]
MRNHNADRLAKLGSRPPDEYHMLPSATYLQSLLSDSSRLAEPPLLPGAVRFLWPLFGRYRLMAHPAPLGAIPVELRLLVFGTLDRFSMNPNNL